MTVTGHLTNRYLTTLLMLIAFGAVCKAQFYTAGDDPASARWYRAETPNYRIIYPEGLDSLARVYGRTLERYRHSVGLSAGFDPGECTAGRLPVILHAFNASSNGSVAWAPKRMDFFTSPQAYASEAMPWTDMLAIHEQRHSSQMQAGLSGTFRPFNWFFGEMFNGLVAGLWTWSWLLEGDAVVAETALSKSGRGRTSDFMNYYMIAFDNGDFRSWNRWKFGSQRHYAPNYYAAGYLLIGGIRFRYGYSTVTGDFSRHIARTFYDLDGLNTVVKDRTGVNLKTAYREIADTLNKIWQGDIEARKPFIPSGHVVKTPSRYTEYSRLEFADDDLYAIKGGMTMASDLVRIGSSGKEHRIISFPEQTSRLHYLPEAHRFYWSENAPHVRWSLKINSAIRYYDTEKGRRGTLSRKGRLFSPVPSPDEEVLCTTEYFDNGQTGLTILDTYSGKRLASVYAPDTVQLVESAWTDDTIYATGISSGGYGIYAIDIVYGNSPDGSGQDGRGRDGSGRGQNVKEHAGSKDDVNGHSLKFGQWKVVIEPQPVQITNFSGDDDCLYFASDRTGVKEFYRFDIGEKELFQKTSTRYGAEDFVYDPDGEMLYYSVKRHEGNIVARTPVDSLFDMKVDFSDLYSYPMADELSRQEKELAMEEKAGIAGQGKSLTDGTACQADDSSPLPDSADGIFEFSKPERYRKFPHLMRIHSWAPFYFNVDNIMAFSGEQVYDFISLGATALSQNDLGTAVSQFGYSAHKDPYNPSKWRHSGHAKFTYTGLFPVIEATVDFNDRGARVSSLAAQFQNSLDYGYYVSRSRETGKPYVYGNLSMYIPFNFSLGGWYTGLVPRVSYSIANDFFHTGMAYFQTIEGMDGNFLLQRTPGKNIPLQYLTGSLRFYTMRPTADSGIYPRWGFGAEAGARFSPGLNDYYYPACYLNLYGYLPGIIPQHGLSLSALYQTIVGHNRLFSNTVVETRPRGFTDTPALSSYMARYSTNSLKLSASYGIPLYFGDLSVFGSFMYIKRFVVTPHFDYTMFGTGLKGIASNGLFSAGATVSVDLSCLFWLEFPFQVGVTCSYNGGPSFNAIQRSGVPISHFDIGPVFSISFN